MTDSFEFENGTFVSTEKTSVAEWAQAVAKDRPVPVLTLKNDDIFLITDTLGSITNVDHTEAGDLGSMGLYCRDTRYLSRLELQIDGRLPVLLSSSAQKGFALSVLCANPELNNDIKAETIGIQRKIVISGSMFEEIQISNYNSIPVSFQLSLSFDADFADIFEVRGFKREKWGQKLYPKLPILSKSSPAVTLETLPEPAPELVLAYQGLDGALMESRITFDHYFPDRIQGYTAVWQVHLEARESKTLSYRVQFFQNNRSASAVNAPTTLKQAQTAEFLIEQQWDHETTHIFTDNKAIEQIINRAKQDLYLLRQTFAGRKVLAAGVPWFSTLFGRDAIISASQTLLLNPAITRDTLYVLAEYQGKTDNEWREEESGKIMHELRLGEMARCHETPHTPYYGTVDATPLWLMLYAEYFAWTADTHTLDQLWENALLAMDWIDRQCQGTGYLAYNRRSAKGLYNQGWKDSDNCIVDSKGQLASPPIALAEVQGYVYAAKIRLSEIAHRKGLPELAERWQSEAQDLKQRFNQDFWLYDRNFCALALDGNGKPIDSITSNPGHCLSLGIFDLEKAHAVAERLQAPDMFNGWGIRTLSNLSPAYNPMGYHLGSVWHHDNSIIALGLRSLGLTDQSMALTQGLLDMTCTQAYQRPPELFCGYERTDDNDRPIQYPVACSPQAWASGTIYQLLCMMVNLVPDTSNNYLRIIDPTLLPSINYLAIQNLHIGQTILDLEFERANNAIACRVTKKIGTLRVAIEA